MQIIKSLLKYSKRNKLSNRDCISLPLYKSPGYHHLKRLPDVKTVIDVGVGDQGSPFLYSAFPHANFISIDALHECQAVVDKHLGISNKNKFFSFALGDQDGVAFIDVREKISQSSILQRSDGDTRFTNIVEKRRVQMRRLDDVLSSCAALENKILLKIDAEGFEKPILHGSKNTLKLCDYVVLELPLNSNYKDGFLFSSLVEIMASYGLEAAAIINLSSSNVDICFSRQNIHI